MEFLRKGDSTRSSDWVLAVTTDRNAKLREQVPSLWAFGGLTRREVLKRLWCGINDDDLIDRSYELAYNFLVAIFPLSSYFWHFLDCSLPGRRIALRSFLLFQAMLPPAGYELLGKR